MLARKGHKRPGTGRCRTALEEPAMSSKSHTHISGHGKQYSAGKPTHCKEFALDTREFELLFEGALKLDHKDSVLETAFALIAMGRLGLRVSELVHLRNEWINMRDRMIEIPHHEPCDMGRGGSICGSCKQHAEQRADYNPEISIEQALADSWRAKTTAAARSIPFDFDSRVELWVERFYDRYEQGWPYTHSTVKRRLDWAQDAADGLEGKRIFPHALRATAASHHAAQGLESLTLQAILGWSDAQTADRYITHSGERAAAVLRDTYQR